MGIESNNNMYLNVAHPERQQINSKMQRNERVNHYWENLRESYNLELERSQAIQTNSLIMHGSLRIEKSLKHTCDARDLESSTG